MIIVRADDKLDMFCRIRRVCSEDVYRSGTIMYV